MPETKKRLPAEKRRKQILRCAIKVFARSNYQKTRVADIAVEAGISEATIYKYFPSKKSIFVEVLQYMSQNIVSRLEEEGSKERDALEAVRSMGRTFYKLIVNHSEEVKVQFQAISEIDDIDIARRLRQDQENYIKFIGGIIERGIEQGSIRKDLDIRTLVLLLDGVGVFIELMRLLAFEEEFTEKAVTRMTDHLIELMRA